MLYNVYVTKYTLLSDITNRCSNMENTPMKTSVEYILAFGFSVTKFNLERIF